jgi:hypothetical protein
VKKTRIISYFWAIRNSNGTYDLWGTNWLMEWVGGKQDGVRALEHKGALQV